MQDGWRKRLEDTVEAIKAAGGPDMKALSKTAGLSEGYIHSILKQGRTPSIESFLAVAQACKVEAGWLLLGDERFQLRFPVIGETSSADTWRGAGGERIQTALFEPGADAHDMVVIVVRGDANAPVYRNGDMLFCARTTGPNLHNIITGRDCVVRTRDGEGYIKHVVSGAKPGTFTLRSVTNPVAPSIDSVVLQWAAPIEWVKRGR